MSAPEKPSQGKPGHDKPGNGKSPPDETTTRADDETEPTRAAEQDAVRRRRRARIFGEALPDGTRDERGDQWGEREDRDGSEEWLRGQVPPHHG